MKKEMTSFDVAAVVLELDQTLKNARIKNIYQTTPTTLLLKLHQPNRPPIQLLIDVGKRLHLTSYLIKTPIKPPSFCMALRKYLRNGVVEKISQHEFERIVTFTIKAQTNVFQLIIELFGDGNAILVDAENTILQARFYKKMRDRNILKGEVFRYPPPRGKNPLEISREQFHEIRNFGSLEIVKALTRHLSLGGIYAEEILLRAKVDKKTACQALTEQDLDRIFNELKEIASVICEGKIKPCIIMDEKGEYTDVTPFQLQRYAHLKCKGYATFNEALDEFYTKTAAQKKLEEISEKIKQELERQQRILEKQKKALEKAEKQIRYNKMIGDLIYTHFHSLQWLMQRILEEKRKGKTWEQISSDIEREKKAGLKPASLFHSLNPKLRILYVSINNETFPISLKHAVQAEASSYYMKAKKAEKKLEGIQKALKETFKKIEQLKRQATIEKEMEISKPPLKMRKKAWYEKFRWFHSSDNLLVLGGKDATTNEILIKKHTEPKDVVFHSDIHGAPFVIIKTKGKPPPQQTMKEAAEFAAAYSRAWKEQLSKIDVYWVHPEQLSKTPPSRQYLKKGAFMIRGRKNYIKNVPLQIAIGIMPTKEMELKVIGGPTKAIAKHTNIYAEIVPGDTSSSELAKKLRQVWTKKAPQDLREQILKIPLEEIQRFIPSGKSRMLPFSK